MGEKFTTNPVNGSGATSVPIFASPGRSGFGPQLALSYDSGAGNGPFGFGWSLALPSVTRKTDKGLPRYDDAEQSDVFLLSGAEDLVPMLAEGQDGWVQTDSRRTVYGVPYAIRRYRPRIEGLFARIERWTSEAAAGEVFWRSISRDNVTTWYGRTPASRISDPADAARIFSWLICESHDDKGNVVEYCYRGEDDAGIDTAQAHEANRTTLSRSPNRYLKRVLYGNRTPYLPDLNAALPAALPTDGCFELVFDYGGHDRQTPLPIETDGDWACRDDPFSTYRAGFEVRTYRLCRRVLMFHHFPDDPEVGNACLVRATGFAYSSDRTPADPRNPIYSFLESVQQTGYRRAGGGYRTRTLPPIEFGYSEPVIDETVREVDAASLENLPQGLDETRFQWVDLDGEGLSGILTEQGGHWHYKRNLSQAEPAQAARFAPIERVGLKPSPGALSGGQRLMDLDGDGMLELVGFEGSAPGYSERGDADWGPFRTFAGMPVLDWGDPNLKFIDLTGDGHADLLLSEDEAFVWHESRAKDGFAAARRVAMALDEEKGARVAFANARESVFLADLSGDGLVDIARIRNGEVSYWPNLGHGRFGARVAMDNAPRFESADDFDGRRIRLVDLDGSGPVGIVYFASHGTDLYFNHSGNGWSERRTLGTFPPVDTASSAAALDLLGNGTACLVWSSPLPGAGARRMRYIDLMGGRKPHLLIRIDNNLGTETRVHYAPSTRFYLADKLAGRPWITRLPFPVQVVERVETHDHVSGNRFVSRHAYHHGHFDGVEREFRGFGMVEQWDTEDYAALSADGAFPAASNVDAASHLPPVLTRSWFHTGVYLGRNRVSNYFAGLLTPADPGEYYREPGATLLDDTVLEQGWTIEEEREACRSLKGSMLRQEVYALDGSARAADPYTVVEQNFTIERIQPIADNRHGVFLAHPREVLTYHYERDPADPRIAHALTLEVDSFGQARQALAAAYARRPAKQDPNLPEQARPAITYKLTGYTNAIDTDDAYRAPIACDTKEYELTGFAPTGERFSFEEWTANGFAKLAVAEIPYEATPGTTPQKRLIERLCALFRSDDLASVLALGNIAPRAIPYEAYKLAFTPGLIGSVYERPRPSGPPEVLITNRALVLGGQGGDCGGYVDLFGDGCWWVPSGRSFFDPGADVAAPASTAAQERALAAAHFWQPRLFADPFGKTTSVDYDPNALAPVRAADFLNNVTQVEIDYRSLQPRLVTDPNGNRIAAAFDALGRVAGTAVQGKAGETLGDTLAAFDSDPPQADVEALFAAADPATLAPALLADATSCVIHDESRFQRTRAAHPGDPSQWQPAASATIAREIHMSALDVGAGEESPVQIGFAYSDGFGREIQKKIQAEPGPAPPDGANADPRWVGSGWTIFNNKGKPVRQYEPFFTASHDFEFARIEGVSPILFYDPAGRVVATLHADHGWEKVVFGPWHQESWDAGDTILADDPAQDSDIGDHFARLPSAAYLPSWRQARLGGALGQAAKIAAERTEVHAATPTIAHLDPLGRTVLSVAHNRRKTSDMSAAAATLHPTRTLLDIEGNQRATIDARLRTVMRHDYDMLGHPIRQSSMDGGMRWTLADVAGKPIRAWDERGHGFRTVYDALRRPIEAHVDDGTGERLAIVTIYGEGLPNPEPANLRGKVAKVRDQAGIATTDSYDFKGNLLASSRRLAKDYRVEPDWSGAVPLEAETYASATSFDAFNRPTALTSPDGSVIVLGHNEANLLERVDVHLRGAAAATPFVANIDYDAKGQRMRIAYGAGAVTDHVYDPLTFRLARLTTTRPGFPAAEQLVQDLAYTHDPVGNITRIEDSAQQTIFFAGRRVEPSADYVYDALHQLVEASGREHLGQAAGPTAPDAFNGFHTGLVQPGDGDAMGTYVERYLYDLVGNILEMQHRGSDPSSPGWTRSYAYAEPSLIESGKVNNRLTSTDLGGPVDAYAHDAHGNMIAMPHLPLMQWDSHDRLRATARQIVSAGTPEMSWYVYDAAGQRVRKVTDRAAGPGDPPVRKNERIYLGGFEIYREYAVDGTVQLERETLHVMDDKRRVALVETRTQGTGPEPAQLIRYQIANHLGSSSIELDDQGAIVSYEEYFLFGGSSYQALAAPTVPKRYRFTGKERDEESGLLHCGDRYYSSALGRWTSCDPSSLKDGVNMYCYVHNNPARLVDSTGHQGHENFDDPNKRFALASSTYVVKPIILSPKPPTYLDKIREAYRVEHGFSHEQMRAMDKANQQAASNQGEIREDLSHLTEGALIMHDYKQAMDSYKGDSKFIKFSIFLNSFMFPALNTYGPAITDGLEARQRVREWKEDAVNLKKYNFGHETEPVKDKSMWNKSINEQGKKMERAVLDKDPSLIELPYGFKTADAYHWETETLVSIKTLDINTESRINNPKQIFNTLKGYIDKLADFEYGKKQGVELSAEIISNRQLSVGIPSTINFCQDPKVIEEQMNKVMEYAKYRSVNVVITYHN